MTKKLTKPQITKILKEAGINFLPECPKDLRTNCFWFDGKDLVVSTEWTKGRASKALERAGRSFGGFRCGWGGWILREDYTLDYTAELVHNNID